MRASGAIPENFLKYLAFFERLAGPRPMPILSGFFDMLVFWVFLPTLEEPSSPHGKAGRASPAGKPTLAYESSKGVLRSFEAADSGF